MNMSDMTETQLRADEARLIAVIRAGRRMRDNREHYEVNDVLELVDVETGKIVLCVGTGNTEDYYPYWVAEWSPENMACNSNRVTRSGTSPHQPPNPGPP